MGFHRQTQHRVGRDMSDKKEVSELRSQNQQLRRENARLRRQLQKYDNSIQDAIEDPEPVQNVQNTTQNVVISNGCCQTPEIVTVNLGVHTFEICKTCKNKKKV